MESSGLARNARDGYDFDLGRPAGTGCHNVVNAFYYGMLKDLNQIKDILGIEYVDESDEFRSSFLKTFYYKKKRLFVDAEGSNHSALHSNVLPLYFDLTPPDGENIQLN